MYMVMNVLYLNHYSNCIAISPLFKCILGSELLYFIIYKAK